jgi:hypothetical protein
MLLVASIMVIHFSIFRASNNATFCWINHPTPYIIVLNSNQNVLCSQPSTNKTINQCAKDSCWIKMKQENIATVCQLICLKQNRMVEVWERTLCPLLELHVYLEHQIHLLQPREASILLLQESCHDHACTQ